MGLNISLTDRETGETVAEMSWLRNPFGLCQWAEDNADPGIDFSLHFVCNEWNYDKGDQVNRPLFKGVVDAYAERVWALERGRFYFTEKQLVRFVENPPILSSDGRVLLPYGRGTHPRPGPGVRLCTAAEVVARPEVFRDDEGRYAVPQEWFVDTDPVWGRWDTSLAKYQAWFGRLVVFADLLQDERYSFYCSN